jgi:hypothetical protein
MREEFLFTVYFLPSACSIFNFAEGFISDSISRISGSLFAVAVSELKINHKGCGAVEINRPVGGVKVNRKLSS